MKALAVVLLATATATASAEPAPQPSEGKSPGDALALSLGVTLGGAGMMLSGDWFHAKPLEIAGAVVVGVGPSVGQLYAGHLANTGLAVRGAGLLLGATGVLLVQPCLGGGAASSTTATLDFGADRCGLTFAAIGLGTLAFVGGSVYEIATTPAAAHRYNREHGLEATIVPTGTGLALVGRF